MHTRKKRSQRQKEPIGKTKSEILLFIANQENSDYTKIREHLRNQLNIRNQKGIRNHLSYLIKEKLIIKKSQGKGLSDIYTIEKSYDTFKRVFNFLHGNKYSLDFLKTNYSKELLKDDDFLLYGIVDILKNIIIDFMDMIIDSKRYEEFLSEVRKDEIDQKEIENLKIQRDELLSYNIQRYFSMLRDIQPDGIINLIEDYGINKKLLITILNSLLSEQKKDIINIIERSPSAMDYFLNLKKQRKDVFLAFLLKYFLGNIFLDPSKHLYIKEFIKNKHNFKKNPKETLNNFLQIINIKNVINDSPFLMILKAYFIIDSMNYNIVINEYSKETLKKILLPEVKK